MHGVGHFKLLNLRGVSAFQRHRFADFRRFFDGPAGAAANIPGPANLPEIISGNIYDLPADLIAPSPRFNAMPGVASRLHPLRRAELLRQS